MTEAINSLHSFCKEHGLPKTSVRRWLVQQGFDTSNGLTVDAQNAALLQFKPEITEPIAQVGQVDDEATITPEVMPSSSALAHYLGTAAIAPTVSTRGLTLGNIETRLSTREERRAAVGQAFYGVVTTREERRALIEQAALEDADDDAEVYAAVYQSRLDRNLQRHAMATTAVLGKDVEAEQPQQSA